MDVVMYSTECPKCNVLKKKLDNIGIKYSVVNNVSEMEELDIVSVPTLMVDGNLMDFIEATKWANGYSNNKDNLWSSNREVIGDEQ